jgi:hypothetical protein
MPNVYEIHSGKNVGGSKSSGNFDKRAFNNGGEKPRAGNQDKNGSNYSGYSSYSPKPHVIGAISNK